jgi:hypothetical protein
MIEAAYRHHGMDARYIDCDASPAGRRVPDNVFMIG